MSAAAFTLTEADLVEAEKAWRRFRNENLGPADLASEIDHWLQQRALFLGDFEAADYRDHDEVALRGGIAYAEQRLAELVRPAERAARSLHYQDNDTHQIREGLGDRFAAAKWADLVGLAETLTAQLAIKTGHGRYRIRCPFHGGDREPSLVIYPPGRGWYCFGCGKGGDPVAFVAELQNWTAIEALVCVEQLADAPEVAS